MRPSILLTLLMLTLFLGSTSSTQASLCEGLFTPWASERPSLVLQPESTLLFESSLKTQAEADRLAGRIVEEIFERVRTRDYDPNPSRKMLVAVVEGLERPDRIRGVPVNPAQFGASHLERFQLRDAVIYAIQISNAEIANEARWQQGDANLSEYRRVIGGYEESGMLHPVPGPATIVIQQVKVKGKTPETFRLEFYVRFPSEIEIQKTLNAQVEQGQYWIPGKDSEPPNMTEPFLRESFIPPSHPRPFLTSTRIKILAEEGYGTHLRLKDLRDKTALKQAELTSILKEEQTKNSRTFTQWTADTRLGQWIRNFRKKVDPKYRKQKEEEQEIKQAGHDLERRRLESSIRHNQEIEREIHRKDAELSADLGINFARLRELEEQFISMVVKQREEGTIIRLGQLRTEFGPFKNFIRQINETLGLQRKLEIPENSAATQEFADIKEQLLQLNTSIIDQTARGMILINRNDPEAVDAIQGLKESVHRMEMERIQILRDLHAPRSEEDQ